MPTTPNQAIRCRSWFIASVATRSPGLTPNRSRAWARRRDSRATSIQLVRIMVPSGRAATISRLPCSRSAWSISRMMRSGKSCIAPSAPISGSPRQTSTHHAAKTRRRKRLERKLEPRRERQAALHLLHLVRGGRIGLGASIVDCRGDQVLDHHFLGWLKQCLVDVDAEDPAFGGGPNLDHAAAGSALDLDLVE